MLRVAKKPLTSFSETFEDSSGLPWLVFLLPDIIGISFAFVSTSSHLPVFSVHFFLPYKYIIIPCLYFSSIFVLFRLFYLAVQSSLFTFSFSFSSLYFFCSSLSFQFYFFYFTLVIEFHVDSFLFFLSKSQTYLPDLSFFTYRFFLVSFSYLFLSLFTECPAICFSFCLSFLFLISFRLIQKG
jgi:hypothetical protein